MYGSYEKSVLDRLHRAEMVILKDFIAICEKYNINYFAIAGTAIGAVRHQGFIPWDDDIDIAMLREDYERFAEVAPAEFGDKYEMMSPEHEKKYYNLQPAMVRLGTKFVTENAWAGGYEPGLFLDLFIFENIPDDEAEAAKIIKKCRTYKILYIARNVNHFKLLRGRKLTQKVKNIVCGFIRLGLLIIPHSDRWLYKKYMSYAKKYYGKSEHYTALCDPGSDIMGISRDEIFPLVDMPFEDITIKMLNNYKEQLSRHMGNYMEVPPVEKRTNHSPRELDFGSDL